MHDINIYHNGNYLYSFFSDTENDTIISFVTGYVMGCIDHLFGYGGYANITEKALDNMKAGKISKYDVTMVWDGTNETHVISYRIS